MSFFLYGYSINFIRCIFKIENSFSRLYIDIYIIFETFNSYFVVTFRERIMDERKHSDQEQIIKHNCNEKKESSRGRIINDSPSPFPVMLIHREKREDGRRDAIPSQHRFLRDSVNSVNKARAKKKYDFPEGNHNSLPAGSS